MITEDQLEQLAIQWFQDTGWNYVHGAVIAPEGVAAEREVLRTLTPALSQRAREKEGRVAEVRRRVASPGQAMYVVTKQGFRRERGEPLNKERRYPIALTMRGPWERVLPRIMGFPWTSADGLPWGHPEFASRDLPSLQMQASGFRRSLLEMPRWGGRKRGPTIKPDLMVRSGVGVRATCKDCLQDRLERNQKP